MKGLLVACATALVAAINNGKGVTPPMGWRDWNFFQCNIDQPTMLAIMDAMVDRSRTVNGVPTSLADMGYNDVGLDDCWQACGSYGPNAYTYHNASGYPQVNQQKFPNMAAMTAYAHSLNLTAGWYGNNCVCADHCSDDSCYQGDVDALIAFGFDSVKYDGCGKEMDLTKWANTIASYNKSILIEACHGGGDRPNATWCPFNYYRSSTDARPVFGSVLTNINSIPWFTANNLSTPGCWAYPDMLEVGVTNTQGPLPPLSYVESRSNFGLWCIVSSPLILGLNVSDGPTVEAVWDIITNEDAIRVNQAYAGFSGTIFLSSNTTTPFAPCSWTQGSCTFPTWQYLYKPLPNGQTAVLLLNSAPTTTDLTVDFATVPGLTAGGTYTIYDIWSHDQLGSFTGSYTARGLTPHDSAFIILSQ